MESLVGKRFVMLLAGGGGGEYYHLPPLLFHHPIACGQHIHKELQLPTVSPSRVVFQSLCLCSRPRNNMNYKACDSIQSYPNGPSWRTVQSCHFSILSPVVPWIALNRSTRWSYFWVVGRGTVVQYVARCSSWRWYLCSPSLHPVHAMVVRNPKLNKHAFPCKPISVLPIDTACIFNINVLNYEKQKCQTPQRICVNGTGTLIQSLCCYLGSHFSGVLSPVRSIILFNQRAFGFLFHWKKSHSCSQPAIDSVLPYFSRGRAWVVHQLRPPIGRGRVFERFARDLKLMNFQILSQIFNFPLGCSMRFAGNIWGLTGNSSFCSCHF